MYISTQYFHSYHSKVDDATEAVTAERSGIGRRHVQRSRELQMDRAETGVNTEERGGDEGH